ncbi:MAG: HNH endonuclease [Candidatus Tectomicrobia bacterium]|nr:HNH endonuclease [Candidatus Tectomicrobia bacterium]
MDKDKLYTEKDEERFLSKIEIDYDSGCWLWQAYTNHSGYGQFRLRKTTVRAHRVMFATWIGNIPDGYEVDHLCKVRHCVNPKHLTLIDFDGHRQQGAEYLSSRDTCINGHRYTEENTRRRSDGRRDCLECHNRRKTLSRLFKRVEKLTNTPVDKNSAWLSTPIKKIRPTT